MGLISLILESNYIQNLCKNN